MVTNGYPSVSLSDDQPLTPTRMDKPCDRCSALRADSAQRQLSNELNQEWRQAPARCDAAGASPEQFYVATGQPFAFITIPAFGPHWRFTLIQGTALAQLDLSPGHVPGTQWPGQVGNFAVAGHRVTAGNPFWSLPSL